jgi:hypothetical protein
LLGRLALLTLLGSVCACNAPPQALPPASVPAEMKPAIVLSSQQIQARAEKCAKDTRERFRKDSSQGVADAKGSVEFAQHYSTKLDTCFLLLTASSPENPGGEFGTSPALVVRKLIDVNENELYGEYLGPPADAPSPRRVPDTCEVMSMYCASGGEWAVLVQNFMEN